MKPFFAAALIIFMGCNNNPAPVNSGSTMEAKPDTEKTETNIGAEPPSTVAYNDIVTVLSMSNSQDRANVNDIIIIYVQVKNTGNDICNMCNVEIRYKLTSVTGETVIDSDISDGSFALNNLLPDQVGNIEIKFPVKQTGNYTFYLTKLYGVFKGTNSTKQFVLPNNAKTNLTVL